MRKKKKIRPWKKKVNEEKKTILYRKLSILKPTHLCQRYYLECMNTSLICALIYFELIIHATEEN